MKIYFTKYLPIEGEIKEGSKVKHNGNIVTALKKEGEGDTWKTNGLPKYGSNLELVKLFLCSRDIQVGDNCIDGEGDTVIIIDNKEESKDGFQIRLEDSYALGCFKVIGEVSPEATWVTEGMEFDRNDFQMIWSNGRHRKRCKYDLIDAEIEPILIAEFKCPTCKQFH